MELQFFVPGIPKPAGSKRAFVVTSKTNSKPRAVVTDDCKTSRDWKTDVKAFAHEAHGGRQLIGGPVYLSIEFDMPRPLAHYKGNNRERGLREGAPHYCGKKPDVLKLARAVEDALTGIVWVDDALIVDEWLRKKYGENPGVHVLVREL